MLLILMMAAALLAAGAFADTDICTESPDGQHHWEHFNFADCESGGMDFWQCTYCYIYRDDEVWVDALGHDWGEWIVRMEATCEQSGTEVRICARCGDTETREIPAKGHTPTAIPAVAATCAAGGKTEGGRRGPECPVPGRCIVPVDG